jgi:DNA mismatch repair protein MutL
VAFPAATAIETAAAPAEARAIPQGPPVLQVHNSYIVTGCDDGLLIVDQHALHERLLYNDLRRRLTEGRLAGQRMLIPQTLAVTGGEKAVLESCAELLERLGIEVAPFGPDSVAVQQFPSLLAHRGVEATAFLRELLDKLSEDETTDSERLLEDILEMMACKAAVKAGQPLTAEEMDSLLRRREEAEKASSCPHGRPTTIKLTLKDLERQFKRI